MKLPARTGPVQRAGRPRKREEPVGIKAAEQAFDVLDALARADRARSLTELCAETRMEPSKLHRYLVSLCARGMAKRSELTGLYLLGPAALSLGALSLSRLDEFGVLREAVGNLSHQLGETSFLYIWSQAGPVLIHNQVPTYALINIRLGSIAPLFGSATGPVFVSYLPAAITGTILVRDASEQGLEVDHALQRMNDELCPRIRDERVHWSEITLIPNSAACAAPVFDGRGVLIGVVGANFPKRGRNDLPQDQLIGIVRDAAANASHALGLSPQAIVSVG